MPQASVPPSICQRTCRAGGNPQIPSSLNKSWHPTVPGVHKEYLFFSVQESSLWGHSFLKSSSKYALTCIIKKKTKLISARGSQLICSEGPLSQRTPPHQAMWMAPPLLSTPPPPPWTSPGYPSSHCLLDHDSPGKMSVMEKIQTTLHMCSIQYSLSPTALFPMARRHGDLGCFSRPFICCPPTSLGSMRDFSVVFAATTLASGMGRGTKWMMPGKLQTSEFLL